LAQDSFLISEFHDRKEAVFLRFVIDDCPLCPPSAACKTVIFNHHADGQKEQYSGYCTEGYVWREHVDNGKGEKHQDEWQNLELFTYVSSSHFFGKTSPFTSRWKTRFSAAFSGMVRRFVRWSVFHCVATLTCSRKGGADCDESETNQKGNSPRDAPASPACNHL
jgi:hypothetical protein